MEADLWSRTFHGDRSVAAMSSAVVVLVPLRVVMRHVLIFTVVCGLALSAEWAQAQGRASDPPEAPAALFRQRDSRRADRTNESPKRRTTARILAAGWHGGCRGEASLECFAAGRRSRRPRRASTGSSGGWGTLVLLASPAWSLFAVDGRTGGVTSASTRSDDPPRSRAARGYEV